MKHHISIHCNKNARIKCGALGCRSSFVVKSNQGIIKLGSSKQLTSAVKHWDTFHSTVEVNTNRKPNTFRISHSNIVQNRDESDNQRNEWLREPASFKTAFGNAIGRGNLDARSISIDRMSLPGL